MNLVDERFELCSLIFRLMPYEQYTGHNDKKTEYQQKLNKTFGKFATHPAVEYATSIRIGFDAAGMFALHMVKRDGRFYMMDDLTTIFRDIRLTNELIETFLPLVNDFYFDSEFESFFNSHMSFYEKETKKFVNAGYSKFDLTWFEKYIGESKLNVIYSPSIEGNYGCTAGNNIYAIVPRGDALVHEFCHHFANPIADNWYETNDDFKRLCDESVNTVKHPWYPRGEIIAREYVTRAYDVLYQVQHDGNFDELIKCDVFVYMKQVYDMILQLETSGGESKCQSS